MNLFVERVRRTAGDLADTKELPLGYRIQSFALSRAHNLIKIGDSLWIELCAGRAIYDEKSLDRAESTRGIYDDFVCKS